MELDTETVAKVYGWPPSDNDEPEGAASSVPELTELGNAARLVAAHGTDLRYCHPWARWLVWDGRRWAIDDTGEVVRRAKATIRALLVEAAEVEQKELRRKLVVHAERSQSDRAIKAVLSLAQSEPGVPVRHEQLDVDPWLLCLNNGTLDLRTGRLREHDRADLITKLAPVDYDPDARCPLWLAFLERVLAGDSDLIEFVRRAVGYSLTGMTNEQVFFLLYGTGANGKTTFVETVRGLLGDYGLQSPAETFLERRDTIPNDVARLRGARFVAATETPEGRRLNEPLVKRLTGGDKITARFMRAEWFEFDPMFKVWLATNHKPEIRGTDEAIWRRVRLIPFMVTIPEKERDGEFVNKLREELPGILRWTVEGCQAWRADGLGEAEAVVAATSAYREDSDVLGGFIEDECELDPAAKTKASELYTRFGYWCIANGEEQMSQKAFGLALEERGFPKDRASGGTRMRSGLKLTVTDDAW